MKKIIIIPMFFLFIVGISGFYLYQKQTSPNIVVMNYYTDLMQQQYTKAAELIADHQLQIQRVTKEEWAAAEKKADSKNNLKITSFQLDSLKDVDSSHKQGRVTLQVIQDRTKRSITEGFDLVQERERWKMDFSKIEGTSIPLPVTIETKDYSIQHLALIKNAKGMTLSMNLQNLSSQNAIRIGLQRQSSATLETSQGTYSVILERNMIMPTQSATLQLPFDSAKGELKTLTMSDCYLTGLDGLALKGMPPLSIRIDFSK